MPQIKQYFADAKITPSDRGSEAWEQAGRRLGAYAEQNAQGLKQEGQDIAKLWNEAKFGIDLGRAETLENERRGGGSGGVARGGIHDALDFGARSNWGNGNVPGAYGQNESSVSGYGRSSGSYNARAAREIGGAAAGLPGLIGKILDGQGLTDQQYQQLGTSPTAAARLANARAGGQSAVLYGDEKGSVQPNPTPSDEELSKNGYTVSKVNDFGQIVQDYPLPPNDFHTRMQRTEGLGAGHQHQDQPADISQTLGAQNWGAITQEVTGSSDTATPAVPDAAVPQASGQTATPPAPSNPTPVPVPVPQAADDSGESSNPAPAPQAADDSGEPSGPLD